MPAARSLFRVALPKIFGSTKGATYNPGSSGTFSISRLVVGPNKIRVDQEWTVLREHHTSDGRVQNDSDIALVIMGEEGADNGNKESGQRR